MEARYRGHRLIIELLPVDERALTLKIVSLDGFSWPLLTFEVGESCDLVYRASLDHGMQLIDEACSDRLAFPWDENQPRL